ncbi:hypothetical protein [Megasphaera sueciensis]|uniref:hypothetical protein n=1 Tax=Megasphaera sueciensis TaxID=349094 RepID=UPI003D04A710
MEIRDLLGVIGIIVGSCVTYKFQLSLQRKKDEEQSKGNAIMLQIFLYQIILNCATLLDKYCVEKNQYMEKIKINEFSKLPLENKFPNIEVNDIKEFLGGLDKSILVQTIELLVCINSLRKNHGKRNLNDLSTKADGDIEITTSSYDFKNYIKDMDQIMQKSMRIIKEITITYNTIKSFNDIEKYVADIHCIMSGFVKLSV